VSTSDIVHAARVQHEAVTSSVHHRGPTADRYQSAVYRYLSVVADDITDDAPQAGDAQGVPATATQPAATQSVRGRHSVADVMTTAVVSAHEGAVFKEIVDAIARNHIGAVPVVDEEHRVLGVVSESDLLARLAGDHGTPPRGHRLWAANENNHKIRALTASELMTSPAVTTTAASSIAEAARHAARARVRRMPVVDASGVLVGMVTRGDLLRIFLRPDDQIRDEIIDSVLANGLPSDAGPVQVDVQEGIATLTGHLDTGIEVEALLRRVGQIEGVVAVANKLSFRVEDRSGLA
jgi:CBS domain-containing protein